MGLNQHPAAKVFRSDEPFEFETRYMGQVERIPYVEVGYETWGDPANPAILVTHALSGNTHAADLTAPDDFKASWWAPMVGPGRVVDTDRYFVICPNMLGGCGGSSGPASINPDTGEPFGLHFPVVTVGDMVRSQKLLVDHLGVKKLFAVIGGSMGGFQALEWAIMYPDFVERIVPLGSSAYSNQFMILTNRVQIDAIQSDCNYENGAYHNHGKNLAGLAVARMVGFTTFISPIMMERKFAKSHRSLREPYRDGGFHQQLFHEAENYLRHVSEPFMEGFDPNAMVYLLQSWSHFDLAIKYGSLAEAMKPVRARSLIVCATGDNLFPPYLSEEVLAAMRVHHQDAELFLIEDEYGHDFFLIPEIILNKIAPSMREFLES